MIKSGLLGSVHRLGWPASSAPMAGREDVALAVLTDQKVHSDRNK